jgi:dTMP kinase
VTRDAAARSLASAHPRFVTFEGVDGAGKSTHLAWFAAELAARTGAEVVLTREPGGTAVGEALRDLVLHRPMHLETEALLMFAARRQNIAETIAPALARGAWVVCDRFTDATLAYQGGGRGLPVEKIEALRDWVHPGLEPGTTILFDLAPDVAKKRLERTRDKDRFEEEPDAFFGRVRETYLRLAAARPDRYRVVDGSMNVAEVQKELEKIITSLCL